MSFGIKELFNLKSFQNKEESIAIESQENEGIVENIGSDGNECNEFVSYDDLYQENQTMRQELMLFYSKISELDMPEKIFSDFDTKILSQLDFKSVETSYLSKIEDLEYELTQVKNYTEEQKRDIDILNQKLKIAEDSIAKNNIIHFENKTLKAKVINLNQSNEEKLNKLLEMEKEKTEMKSIFMANQKEKNSLEKEIDIQKEKYEGLVLNCDLLRKELEASKQSILNLTEEKIFLKSLNEDYSKKVKKQNIEVSELKSELGHLDRKSESQIKEIAKLRKLIDQKKFNEEDNEKDGIFMIKLSPFSKGSIHPRGTNGYIKLSNQDKQIDQRKELNQITIKNGLLKPTKERSTHSRNKNEQMECITCNSFFV